MLGRRLATTAIALAVILAAGCSPGSSSATATTVAAAGAGVPTTATTLATPKEKPEDFIKRFITEQFAGQSGLSYNDLLPQQQVVVTKATFINCTEKNRGTAELDSISIVKVYTENTPTPGVGDLDSTAVTVRVTLHGLGPTTLTLHAFNVGGRWRSSLDQATFDAESKGGCGQ